MGHQGYFAIIPANVRYDESLTPNAKLLYGEITALCNEKGYCWAGDSYFADLYKVSKTSIQKWMKSLQDNSYIKREVVYVEGTKQIKHRYITIVGNPTQDKLVTPTQDKLGDNNTLINNTNNNTSNNNIVIPHKEIIDYLNEKTGKGFRLVESNKKHITARWNEGYALEDFIKVIDNKTLDSKNPKGLFDPKYLQPSTLFGTRFDQYLNQTISLNEREPDYSVPEEFQHQLPHEVNNKDLPF